MIKNKIYLTPLIILAIIIIFLAISINKSTSKNNFLQNNRSQEKIIKLPEFQLSTIKISSNKLARNSSPILEESFSNQDLKGRISIINFFASWCIICAKEHNLIKELGDIYNQKTYRKKIAIFGVAWRDLEENAISFLNNNGNYYHKVALDSKNSLGKLINLSGVPETIITNQKGEIIKKYQGQLNRDNLIEIKQIIDNEIKNQSPDIAN